MLKREWKDKQLKTGDSRKSVTRSKWKRKRDVFFFLSKIGLSEPCKSCRAFRSSRRRENGDDDVNDYDDDGDGDDDNGAAEYLDSMY